MKFVGKRFGIVEKNCDICREFLKDNGQRTMDEDSPLPPKGD